MLPSYMPTSPTRCLTRRACKTPSYMGQTSPKLRCLRKIRLTRRTEPRGENSLPSFQLIYTTPSTGLIHGLLLNCPSRAPIAVNLRELCRGELRLAPSHRSGRPTLGGAIIRPVVLSRSYVHAPRRSSTCT